MVSFVIRWVWDWIQLVVVWSKGQQTCIDLSCSSTGCSGWKSKNREMWLRCRHYKYVLFDCFDYQTYRRVHLIVTKSLPAAHYIDWSSASFLSLTAPQAIDFPHLYHPPSCSPQSSFHPHRLCFIPLVVVDSFGITTILPRGWFPHSLRN